jgi:hypothetical protein
VVFYREHKLSERIDLIAKSLPIIDQIGALQTENKIGPEQAEILRRKVISGVCNFISAGAIIPEFEHRSNHSPRLLMTPEQKLLTSPHYSASDKNTLDDVKPHNEYSTEQDEDISAVITNMTEKERAKFMKLLKKKSKTIEPNSEIEHIEEE